MKWQERDVVTGLGQDLDEVLVVNSRDYGTMFPKTKVFETEFQDRFLSVRDGSHRHESNDLIC